METQWLEEVKKTFRDTVPRLEESTRIVLVVDDEPMLRELVVANIKRIDRNLVVVQAENGKDAMDKLLNIRNGFSRDPLMVITDLNMPVMDGWKLIQVLQKDYTSKGLDQGIPVIVFSATTGEKRIPFFKQTVHGDKKTYVPLVSVAKEDCVAPNRFDTRGKEGLLSWVKHFIQQAA